MNAIDTNVLVYSFDADDSVRQQQAIELIDQLSENPDDTVLPWQVIVECLACLRRWVDRGRLSASDVATYGRRFDLVSSRDAVHEHDSDIARINIAA